MRAILFLLLICTMFVTLRSLEDVRSVSINVEEATQIKFSVSWGWGMDQRIQLLRKNTIRSQVTEEVFKKPYNTGGWLFVSPDKKHYYINLYYGVYHIDLTKNSVRNICSLNEDSFRPLEFLGRFDVAMNLSWRGDDVTFTPAGVMTSGRPIDLGQTQFKDACG